MKVSMESPEVKSGNTGQPRATREIPPLYIFSQAGTCPGVPGKDERQLLRGVAHPRYAIRTRPAFIRTQRVLLPRFRSCRSTALGANRGKHIFAPGAGAPTPLPASAAFRRR